jgi:hypothetical protein
MFVITENIMKHPVFNIVIFIEQNGREKIAGRMVAGIP